LTLPRVAYAAAALFAVEAASLNAGMTSGVPKPLVGILALAGAAIMLTIAAEDLLLGWLFLAPLLQESAGLHRSGSLLGLALYTAPPLVLALKTVLAHGPRTEPRWFDILPGAYVVYVFGSLVFASDALQLDVVGTSRGFYQTVALGAIMYYVVVFWPGRAFPVVKLLWTVLAAAALQAAMSIVEYVTGRNLWDDYRWRRAGDMRSVATLANPALLGAFIGVGMVIALAVLCWDGPQRLRRLSIAVLVLGPPGLIFTYTRGPILATAVAVVPVLLLSSRSRILGLGVIAVLIIALAIAWPRVTSSSVYENRIAQRQNVDVRLVLQQVSLKLAAEKPVFGWGYGSFDRVKYGVKLENTSIPLGVALLDTSHDTFLTILVEYGAVGLALFFLPLIAVCWPALRRVSRGDPERWLTVAVVAAIGVVVLSAATFDTRFFSFVPMLPWLLLGLLRRAEADAASA